ncbi:hypothetical protein V1525DRAFT_336075 [Lipomyces kononenkoae]|uniref:Uncharacterized protein n=1 Tax=Lipomyces kononenkoae TaxID=34357 RepID=A0ACC3TAM5_LIPKO
MKLLYSLNLLLSISSALAVTVHDVSVGQGGLTYSPNSITAAVGDYVRFTWASGPHGVAQAAFSSPCVPLSSPSSGNNDVFFSGIQMPSTTFTIKVNSTDPIFFYCPVDSYVTQPDSAFAIWVLKTLLDTVSSAW